MIYSVVDATGRAALESSAIRRVAGLTSPLWFPPCERLVTMVAPVTGPFSKTAYVNGPPTSYGYKPIWLYKTSSWYRQRKPYNLPLGYSMEQKRITSFQSTQSSSYQDYTQVYYGVPQSFIDNVHNQCYAKFVAKTREEHSASELDAHGHPVVTTTGNSGLGTTLAEIKQSKEMITARLELLVRFTKAVRGYRFQDAFHLLGMHKKIAQRDAWLRQTRVRRSAQAFGNNWLEFHFGWSPLIDDIKQAMEVLTGGLPDSKIRVRHKDEERILTWTPAPTPSYISKDEVETRHYQEQMGADIGVSNPNIWLANRLGLINPLALAWEVVPFSFVVDWFANLNDVIASYSDFYGLTIKNAYTSSLKRVTYRSKRYQQSSGFSETWSSEYVGVGRVGAIQGPVLRMRPAKATSWVRGLTASSLLLQGLKGPKTTSRIRGYNFSEL